MVSCGISERVRHSLKCVPLPAAGAQSAGVSPDRNLPDAIRVDDTKFKIVASLRGVGKHVYDCDASGTKYTFREPVAGLFTSRGVPAGIHAKGPFWANFDGSHVDGRGSGPDTGSAPSPRPAG